MAYLKVARCGLVPAYAGMLVLSLALATWVMPVLAITWEEPDDGDRYPNVGVVIVGSTIDYPRIKPFIFCSGTLIGEKVFLTFGRCAHFLKSLLDEPGVQVSVSFSSENTLNALQEGWLPVAEAITHPYYNPGRTSNPRDVGILILEEPATGITLAELPSEGFLDDLRAEGKLSRRKRAEFVVAGYDADGVRRLSVCEYLNLRKARLHMSQNQAPDRGNIGTSYGDFGGPVFWMEDGAEIVVAITSWGDSQRVATGYRVDTPDMLDFIHALQTRYAVSLHPAPPRTANGLVATRWGMIK